MHGAEIQAMPISNEMFLRTVYRDLLGRDADKDGLHHYSEKLTKNEIDRARVVYEIINSEEFSNRINARNRVKAIAVALRHAPRRIVPTLRSILRRAPSTPPIRRITRDDVVNCYRHLLGREPDSEGAVQEYINRGIDLWTLVRIFIDSNEFCHNVRNGSAAQIRNARLEISDSNYSAPSTLSIHNLTPEKVLVIGSCNAFVFVCNAVAGPKFDYVLFNNAGQLPEKPPASGYDLQLVQLGLRSIFPDEPFLRHDRGELFELGEQRLVSLLDSALRWNTEFGLPTLICNFMEPQQNPMGRLLPKFDLSNPGQLIRRINQRIEQYAGSRKNVFVLDLDGLAAIFGRRYIQDDMIHHFNHDGFLFDGSEWDQERLQPPQPATAYYPSKAADFQRILWSEIVACYRTIRGADQIKIVICDLDDTLWRGVVADEGDIKATTIEGWPLSIAEALLYLKRRGVLLAIVSKNTEERIVELWPSIWGGRLRLDDFAIRKINWSSKAENVANALTLANILPLNALFIDDNPVERALVEQALPGIRTLGADLYLIKHILLHAPETQVATISPEATRRTEMMQAQVKREAVRATMTSEEFLASLNVKITFIDMSSVDHPKFQRAMELINKTNQFNTTGRRWTLGEMQEQLKRGTFLLAFEVEDKFTQYGLVGVVIVTGCHIEQFVMSCRVVGLGIEEKVVSALDERASGGRITAVFVSTKYNSPAAGLYSRNGFIECADGLWERPVPRPRAPAIDAR
jgi:FkbH-like protein